MKMTCLIRTASRNWPDAIALCSSDRSICFKDLEHLIVTQARRLKRLGVQPGDRVGILARSSIDYAALLFAAARLGASTVLLNVRGTPRQWSDMLVESRATLLLVDADHRAGLDGIEIPIWVIDDDAPDSLSLVVPTDDAVPREIDPGQEMTVVYTSGSTGRPKGALLTYVNHYFNAVGSNENIPLQSGDCWLLCLPLHHVGGISILFRSALAGSSAFIMRRFEVAKVNELIDARAVTHLSLVPTMLAALLQHRNYQPLPVTVKAILLGGAPTPSHLASRARELRIPLLTSYGLTEAGSQVCTLSSNDSPERLVTSGHLLKYRELCIFGDDGSEVLPGTVGEIAIRGEVLFKGYLNEETLDPDKWFLTGDLGSLDSDGYLTVHGRKDDMLISGGENIFPREIEAEAKDFPGVDDCAVIGVPDDKWGTRPVLFVEGSSCDLKRLKQHLESRLARIRVPDLIIAIDRLPRIGIDKIDKAALMGMYHERGNGHGAD